MAGPGSILVTGGAGFLGSSIVWALNQRGIDDILVTDVLDRSEKWRNLLPLRFDDYIAADALFGHIEGGRLDHVRTVFHLGACSSTTETDAAYLMRNNFEYTRTLAEWSLRRDARFVYASSAATYGALEGELSDEWDLRTLRPLNMYGYSKQLFDLHAAKRGYASRIAGLKYFNVFGPNEYHKGDMRSMVHKAYEQVASTGRVRLFRSHRPGVADGEQRRDFVYVRDAVDMTLFVADDPSRNGLFNVGSGRAHTWIDLVTPVFTALARPVAIDFIDMPEALRGKYQYFTQANLGRLVRAGHSGQTMPLADAVTECVQQYLVPQRHMGSGLDWRKPGPTP
jgi:ADP-L-glycero-D-manno-heptose 6-epimerase